ncbi:type II toxin-antitoxin system death-on-curing family toxin [Candidatus Daviesbacteria bacterium]|nr:type II toxin-antitoxin system death-on-curing family toxin [Candidatus Daviesbacteria bacterium]
MARPIKSIIRFLSEAEVIAINEEMVAKFGGLHGVKDLHMLRLAVGRPQMSVGFQDAYKTIFDKAAAMFHSIINNHPFLDGNKRTSLFSAILFLERNGWSVEFRRKEAVKFTRRAHNEDYTTEQISKWLKVTSVKIST